MPTEKVLIFDEQGNAKRMKVRIARFLDNEPVTAADKTNIRTTLDVDDSLSGTFTTPLSVTSASDSSFTGGGRVGIGTSSPSSYNADANDLVVGAAGTGNRGLTIASGSANYGVIYFADGTTGNQQYRGAISYNHNTDALSLGTVGATRWYINSSGNLVSNGAYGIDFGSGASTTLDDYEEGYHTVTATPTTSGSVTLSTGANTFTYTKIGNIVSVSGTVIISSVSSPVGGLWLSLPVGSTTLTSSAGLVGGSVYYQDSGTGNFLKPFRIQANALLEILMDASTLAANDRFGLNVTYRTTAS